MLLATSVSAQEVVVAGPIAQMQGPTVDHPVQDPESNAEAKAAAVRAAMLLKIAAYLTREVQPPEKDKEKITEYRIGVLGEDSTTAIAKKILPGKKLGNLTVVIVTISSEDAKQGRAAEKCDLLYIATPIEDKVLDKVVEQHAKQPVPMVCNRPGFAEAGGSIQLFIRDGGVRFEINTERLHEQKIKASSQLLKHSQKGPVQ